MVNRIALFTTGVAGLAAIYLLQKDIQQFFTAVTATPFQAFALGRTFRFIVNDLLVILIIHALFQERKYVFFAFFVQLLGILLLLAPYLYIKSFTAYNGPMLSFIHRLIVNPLLMLMMIPAFYYQKYYHRHA